MKKSEELERYTEHLCRGLGHAARHEGLSDYCRGLMLPIERKSVEPLAAHLDPMDVSAKHQSLHHFVAKSQWSDEAVLEGVREWVLPRLKPEDGIFWIVDDTGYPKKGKHSVGVARQYCGQLGKQDNCQVAVSLSIAGEHGSVPAAYRLYLPKEWAQDKKRRRKAGVPDEVEFATKPEIALEQIRWAKKAGLRSGPVLADAGYGVDIEWRDALSALGLPYCVGVQEDVTVRKLGKAPIGAKTLAGSLGKKAWKLVRWREGSAGEMSSRFAAVRVQVAPQDTRKRKPRVQEWLLIEWPKDEPKPTKYWLSTLPASTKVPDLVKTAKMRWRIERDYQDLKQEFGLDHYEGRGWRGFHHHATLCIAAYGFLTAQRLKPGGVKKNSAQPEAPALPEGYAPRGGRPHAAPRSRFHRHITLLDRP